MVALIAAAHADQLVERGTDDLLDILRSTSSPDSIAVRRDENWVSPRVSVFEIVSGELEDKSKAPDNTPDNTAAAGEQEKARLIDLVTFSREAFNQEAVAFGADAVTKTHQQFENALRDVVNNDPSLTLPEKELRDRLATVSPSGKEALNEQARRLRSELLDAEAHRAELRDETDPLHEKNVDLIKPFLDALKVDRAQVTQRFGKLVVDLDDIDFLVREKATNELLTSGKVGQVLAAERLKHGDDLSPEQSMRLKSIAAHGSSTAPIAFVTQDVGFMINALRGENNAERIVVTEFLRQRHPEVDISKITSNNVFDLLDGRQKLAKAMPGIDDIGKEP